MQNVKWVTRHDDKHVAYVKLARGDKYNALSFDVLEDLYQVLHEVSNDKAVFCVVLEAEGKAFCAGHDLKEMREDSSLETMGELFSLCTKVMLKITEMEKPVIAKVHGIATAAGCQLVASCDLAIASNNAKFATSGINIGLFCSTPMVALSRNVAPKKAFEMLFCGDFISAEQAVDFGLINYAVEEDRLDHAVLEMAEKIASKPPLSIAFGKKIFYKQLETDRKAAYELAAHTMACNMATQDAQAGIDAFLAKQHMPKWQGQ